MTAAPTDVPSGTGVMGVRAIRAPDGTWLLHGRCPYCEYQHIHGGGNGETPVFGYRVPHCPLHHAVHAELGHYELVPEKGQTP